ncbi:MAG TPA: hypothetical protein VLD67_13175 [Vicinamibacterales bacterium]|nr:hypothetical protein [Vicinamibacterales bacterium]
MDSGTRDRMAIRRKAVWGSGSRVLAAVFMASAVSSCGDLTTQGTASSYLIITALEAASGAEPNQFDGTLRSDVETVVDDVPSVFNDLGRVRFVLAMKDPGSPTSPTAPTPANFITVNRYSVRFVRADGRNAPGVDVPYAFDGAFTLTVRDSETSGVFELVRHLAKLEAPLLALSRNGVIISTIAEITFFGRDQTGRDVSVTGKMLVDFGNFADPD